MPLVDVGGDLLEFAGDRGAVLEVRGIVPVLTRLEDVAQQTGNGALLVLYLAELGHGVNTATAWSSLASARSRSSFELEQRRGSKSAPPLISLSS